MRRSMGQRLPSSRGIDGPLITDHIHLQDLELELELLKRKREMIEKQQKHARMGTQPYNRPRPFDYNDQPHQPFQRIQPFNSGLLLSRYDDPPLARGGYSGGVGLLGKRPMNDHQPWEGQSTPKRFSEPQGGPKRKFNSSPSPKVNPIRPLLQGPLIPMNNRPFQNRPQWNKPQPPKGPKSTFPSQRFNNQRTAKPVNKDFRPTKVVKPNKPAATNSSKPRVNKLASLPASERAKLVKEAVDPKLGGFDPNFILRDDEVPCQQLAGRLELALGNILKEMKAKYGRSDPHTVTFQSMFLQRQMKQAIRDRLRGVMMGKFVGKADAIVEQYRKAFPVETDTEIMQIALDAQKSSEAQKIAIKLDNTANVHKYVKMNLNRLLGVTLDDMIDKIRKLYETENADEKSQEMCIQMLHSKVPEFKKIFKVDAVKIKSTDKIDNEDKAKNENNETPDVELVENQNEGDNNQGLEEKSGDAENKNQSGDAGNVENKDHTVERSPEDEEAAAKLDELIMTFIQNRLPYVLPRYKTMLMKLLDVSNTFQITKQAIIEKATEKQKLQKRITEAVKEDGGNEEAIINTNTSTPVRAVTPYMLKILGRPVLPKRKLMQDFLNGFNPCTVKKHRSMHLLFVGFDNKEDYDKMVAVKETTIGNCSVFVKVSEKLAPKSDESLNTTLNDSANSASISSELDEQITDLLTSIRKEEESKDDDVTTEPSSQDTAENGDTEVKLNCESNEEVTSKLNGDAKPEQEDAESKNGAVGTEDTKDDAEGVKNETKANKEELKTETKDEVEVVKNEVNDKVLELKNDAKESGRCTPTRSSSRLTNVTPSSIRTRRASRLANN